jgi:hypothetical protein
VKTDAVIFSDIAAALSCEGDFAAIAAVAERLDGHTDTMAAHSQRDDGPLFGDYEVPALMPALFARYEPPAREADE